MASRLTRSNIWLRGKLFFDVLYGFDQTFWLLTEWHYSTYHSSSHTSYPPPQRLREAHRELCDLFHINTFAFCPLTYDIKEPLRRFCTLISVGGNNWMFMWFWRGLWKSEKITPVMSLLVFGQPINDKKSVMPAGGVEVESFIRHLPDVESLTKGAVELCYGKCRIPSCSEVILQSIITLFRTFLTVWVGWNEHPVPLCARLPYSHSHLIFFHILLLCL